MSEQPATVTVLDSNWPGRALPVLPGDLTRTLPQGLGLDVPIMITPYGIGPDQGFYGLDRPSGDPFHAAPTQEPCGGTLYFDDGVQIEHLSAALGVIGVHMPRQDYAVFGAIADDPIAQRYLHQVRIISKTALAHFFQADPEASALPEQPLTLGAYIESFVGFQRATWNDPNYAYSGQLAGTLGGDGDWAKESLAFGFFVENTSWGVYRLWSRPWLVTK
jgi:hypothetical protein